MVNTTDIATFLGKCHTTATVVTWTTRKNVNLIDDTERMLVHLPEMFDPESNILFYRERYRITLSETGEAALTAMLNDIKTNIIKLNLRQAIAAYTRPSTLCNIELHHSNKAWEHKRTKRWERDIFIDVEWSVS